MKYHLRTRLRLLAISAVAVAPLLAPLQASAALNPDATISLSPGSTSVTKGGAANFTINVNRGSNQVNTWRVYLTYPTSLFSGGSLALTNSPFNWALENSVSNGEVTLVVSSLAGAAANTYSGPIATLSLNSVAAGSGTVAVGPKCPDGQSDSCNQALSVPDLNNTTVENVLTPGVGTGASVTVNNPAPTTGGTTGGTTTGGTSTGSKGGTTGSTTTKTPTTTTPTSSTPAPTTTTPSATTTTPTDTTTAATDSTSAKVTLTLLDQDGRPVVSAKVTVDGVTGTTDKDGKVTLSGITPGAVTGTVTYKGETKSISLNVKDGSTQPAQSANITIKVKKSSSAAPIVITVGTLAVVAGAAYALAGPGNGLSSLIKKLPGAGGPKPTAPSAGAGPTPPTTPTPPAPTPQASATTVQENPQTVLPKHVDPMAPGTTFTPNTPA